MNRDRFGINMKRFCREHEARVTAAVEAGEATEELLEERTALPLLLELERVALELLLERVALPEELLLERVALEELEELLERVALELLPELLRVS